MKVPESPKLVFLGNMNNLGFYYAGQMQQRGYNTTLLVDQKAENSLERPEGLDLSLKQNYPHWIKELPILGYINFYKLRLPLLFFKKLIRRLNSFEVVVLNGMWIALAPFIKKESRVVIIFAGFDLEIWGNRNKVSYLTDILIEKRKAFRWVRPLVYLFCLRIIQQQRRGILRADAVNYFPTGINVSGDQVLAEIKNGQHVERLELRGFPCDAYPYINNFGTDDIFKILNFTRFFFSDLSRNDNKRNDIMIRGIARFIKANQLKPSQIIIEFYEKGEDVQLARELIAACGIQDYITWKSAVSQGELNEDIKTCHLVFDQLGEQWIGYGLVAMLYGKPAIANCRPEIFEKITGEKSPVCQATTEEDVAYWLEKLYYDRELCKRIGRQCSDYYRKHHNIDKTIEFIIGDKNKHVA